MKDVSSPMTLSDISLLLTEASKISNHRHFVIAGSLSAVGAVIEAPPAMVMSRDLDFYPKLDPNRGFKEIAAQLTEGTAFAKTHGFFADPITPNLLTVSEGWEQRLMQLPLDNGVVAWFLEPNDAAVSKLVRGAENDIRWVRAGMDAGIVGYDVVLDRLRDASISAEEALVARSALQKCVDGP